MQEMHTTSGEESPPNAVEALVKEVAAQLKEKQRHPQDQIRRLMRLMGEEFVRQKLAETLKVEQAGGMLTLDGQRQRSRGGVFFHLCKGALTEAQRAEVFPQPHYGYKKAVHTLLWDERQAVLERLTQAPPGQIRTLQLILHGRPQAVALDEETVRLVFTQTVESEPVQVYPRGVPAPPTQTIVWVVYTLARHWNTVAAQPETSKEEILIEGRPFWDEAAGTMAVWACRLTTRDLERQDAQKQLARQKELDAKRTKKPQAGQSGTTSTPSTPVETTPDPSHSVEVPSPDRASVTPPDKLSQLEQATTTLRERIATKAARGQKTSMEQTLLQTMDKQIEQLKKLRG